VASLTSKGLPVPEVLAAATVILEVVGTLFIIIGYRIKIAALGLAILTIIAGILFHNFWSMPADQVLIQQIMFIKNLSIAGGLLLISTGGVGSWVQEKAG
jgi:putative oxidoreductase